MAGFTRSLVGETISRLQVTPTERVLVRGSLVDGVLESGSALTLQGAITGTLRVRGGAAASLQGALVGQVIVDEGAFALIQGFVSGTILNEGTVVLDALRAPTAQIRTRGRGRTLRRDEMGADIERRLPRVEIDYAA